MRLSRAYFLILLSFLFFLNSNQSPLSDYFSLDYEIINSDLKLTLTAKTQGWLSVGFGSSMFASELFVCYYDSTNTLISSHYNSNDEVTPHIINSQPIVLLSGFRNTTHTSCTIKRALHVTSSNSFNITLSKPMDIIYAFGVNDNFEYHNEGRNQTSFRFYSCGSYCDVCDTVNEVCLKCHAPSMIIDGFCQILAVLSPKYNVSYYLLDDNKNISMTITAENQGWVSLGLGDSMMSADIFACNFTATNDSWKVYEFKSTDEVDPLFDEIQNVELLSASRNTTHTICKFKRSLNTSDLNDTIISLNQDTHIIYAFGESDAFKYHSDKGKSIIRIQKSLDYNNNGTLCIKSDLNNQCLQCRYENFLPDANGECQENFLKDSYEYINENISLFYYILNNNSLSLTIAAKSQGWIAVGLGSSMFQADVFMCHMNTTENKWEALELKSTDETTPLKDEIQNIVLLSALRNTTHTACSFQRELKTNDSSDSSLVLGNNIDLIYAMGTSDAFTYHPLRGDFTMVFNNNTKPVCDEMCSECEANNLCKVCKYYNFIVMNDVCQENFDVETNLLKSDNFSLYYFLLDSNSLTITMISNEQGWVGAGFVSSNNNGLNDLFVCHEIQNNSWNVLEYKYNETGIIIDKIQNVELLKAFRNTTHTSCTIKRDLKTNDSQDVEIILNKKMDMIYGYNNSDDFTSFIQKGVIQAIFSNETAPNSSCTLDICSECKNDNTTCLKCKYTNYILLEGICQENYANEKYITFSLTSNLSLYYMIDNDEISISLIAKAQGWISLGLGSSMIEADVFMCNKTSQNSWQALKMKSTREKTPILDQTQDLTFVFATRNSTHTLCNFRRKLNSSDGNDKEIMINEFNDVIYAIGRNDAFSYHIEKGMTSINFSNSTNPSKCPSSCAKCDSNDQCIACVNDNSVVINGICQINDIAILPSSGVILENVLTLYWNFSTDEKTIQLMIKTSNMGYVSLGLGKCMKNCDIHVAEYDEYSNIILKDMFSRGESYPSKDTDLGGTSDLKLLGYGKKNDYMFIKYERKIMTGDKWDFLLEQGDHEMAYAFSSGSNLQYHNGNRGSFTIHFVQGYNGGVDMEDTTSMTRLHGILLFVAWGGLIDVALFFGRYLKTFKWYVESHGFILFTTCLLSTVMESLLIYQRIIF